ncbi:YokU family protein [Rossellomorea aquimaris]|uniref:Putative YokU family protein n=1 Tax=Rossellomorea aquimaris TaxID=189382 RepID=A0A366EFU4_9BACI|nr:YokU family protein [Rossellomorea aquimaris]RBP01203.1 putative YokU family protein [Rossellomorea aquimaris]
MNNRFKCQWCEDLQAYRSNGNVLWELPDGSKAIKISETPQILCNNCGIVYTEEAITIEIEDQLLLIETDQLGDEVSYRDLVKMERKLKRNYFRFD